MTCHLQELVARTISSFHTLALRLDWRVQWNTFSGPELARHDESAKTQNITFSEGAAM